MSSNIPEVFTNPDYIDPTVRPEQDPASLKPSTHLMLGGQPLSPVEIALYKGAFYPARAMVKAAQERARLEAQTVTDPLTGLGNRRYFKRAFEQLPAPWHQHKRRTENQSSPVLPNVAMAIDLDHFRDFNTRLGHAGTDLMLQEAAREMRLSIRRTDHIARLGGDEFGVFLPETPLDRAVAVGEKMLQFLSRIDTGQSGLVVSASIGIAEIEPHDEFDDVLRRADAAAYVAKDNGRAQVVAYEPWMPLHQG